MVPSLIGACHLPESLVKYYSYLGFLYQLRVWIIICNPLVCVQVVAAELGLDCRSDVLFILSEHWHSTLQFAMHFYICYAVKPSQRTNIKSSKGKTTNNTQGNTHKDNSWSINRKSSLSRCRMAQDQPSPWTAGKGIHLSRFPQFSFCLRRHYKVKSIEPPKFYHPNQGIFWEWNEVLLIITKGDYESARPFPGKPNAGSTYAPRCSQTRRKFCPNHPISFEILWVSLGTPQGFPCGSAGKESTCNAGNLGSIPGLGRSPGEGKGHPLQYSGLENSTDCIVHGVANSRTRLSVFHSLTVDSSTTLSLSLKEFCI